MVSLGSQAQASLWGVQAQVWWRREEERNALWCRGHRQGRSQTMCEEEVFEGWGRGVRCVSGKEYKGGGSERQVRVGVQSQLCEAPGGTASGGEGCQRGGQTQVSDGRCQREGLCCQLCVICR